MGPTGSVGLPFSVNPFNFTQNYGKPISQAFFPLVDKAGNYPKVIKEVVCMKEISVNIFKEINDTKFTA